MLLKTVGKDLFDYEKVLRLVNLASCQNQDNGLLIGIEENSAWIGKDRSAIEYEENGKPIYLLSATDYILIAGREHTSSESPKTIVHTEQLIVVRACDSCSAHIANLLKSDSKLNVHLRFGKFGAKGLEESSGLKISFEDGRLVYFTTLTTKTSPGFPCEILAFSYDKFTLSSSGIVKGAKPLAWADSVLPPS